MEVLLEQSQQSMAASLVSSDDGMVGSRKTVTEHNNTNRPQININNDKIAVQLLHRRPALPARPQPRGRGNEVALHNADEICQLAFCCACKCTAPGMKATIRHRRSRQQCMHKRFLSEVRVCGEPKLQRDCLPVTLILSLTCRGPEGSSYSSGQRSSV